MTLIDHVQHALGIASLVVFAGAGAISLHAIVGSIQPQWRRIVWLAAGRPELTFPPVVSTAYPTRSPTPATQLRVEETDAQLTLFALRQEDTSHA